MDGHYLRELIDNNEIQTLYQPIVSLESGAVIGFEFFSHTYSDISAAELFATAEKCGLLQELDELCRRNAFKTIAENKHNQSTIFVNTSLKLLKDNNLFKDDQLFSEYGIARERVVYQINDSTEDVARLIPLIREMKKSGYKIAISQGDIASSALRRLTDILPHYISLKRSLVKDLAPQSQHFGAVKSIYHICRLLNINVIAEGIETDDELSALMEMGIPFGQGYLIREPTDDFATLEDIVSGAVSEQKQIFCANAGLRYDLSSVGDFAEVLQPLRPDARISDIFPRYTDKVGIPVVADGVVKGLLMKNSLPLTPDDTHLVSDYMDKTPLVVDYTVSAGKVLSLAKARSAAKVHDVVIITRNERYFGYVDFFTLLQELK